MDGIKGKDLYNKGSSEVREIASLTKIMTAYVSLQLAKELNLDLYKKFFTVSEAASLIPGTSASLRSVQRVKIFDLIHALMLPSGNDAALTLAENFGEHIIRARGIKTVPNRAKLSTPNPEKLRENRADPQIVSRINNPLSIFVKEMNKTAVSGFHLK